ncbi:unnamed protein product [Cladocopium goreaui]|uniref:Uncharacterized protein n=1 Tax=Cladocopium goreaui TaxID=2562237 RepID=A0A9P1FQQ1_9DINO|nr:unnamed protein product [Cladocopium goreaui]|mmetsp:Transcript_12726/g.28060  ORF Transcript_12726/g.28060 Transcript_12726/m.28060 type:complete len:137 (+) Transcript_12726:62-472(+)
MPVLKGRGPIVRLALAGWRKASSSSRPPGQSGVPSLLAAPLLGGVLIGTCVIVADFFIRRRSPYEVFLKKKDEEWMERLQKLKEHYAEEKQDPPPGTALFHFVRVNRNAYLLPTGLPKWKVRELEAIEGWRWETER